MSGSHRIFSAALYILILSVCGSRHRRSIRTSSAIRLTASGSPKQLISQRFDCVKELSEPINYFGLNLTLNSSAFLETNGDEADLVESSSNNTWHYIKSRPDFYAYDELEVEFTLIYSSTPAGNCTFKVGENGEPASDSNQHSNVTMTTYTEKTTSPSFFKTTKLDVETTSVKVSTSNNTTIKDTTLPAVSTCLCPCECAAPMSKDNADKMLASMLEDLRIPKSMTSLSKRKLSSATDHRVSCQSIGLVGAFVMTIVFGVIIVERGSSYIPGVRRSFQAPPKFKKIPSGWSLCDCHHWRRSRTSSVIRMDASGSSNELFSQRFDCVKELSDPINYFNLNLTLNSTAFLEITGDEADLVESSSNNTWHYLKSRPDYYAVDQLEVEFTLIYNSTPAGNCSFVVGENGKQTSSNTLHSHMTMTSYTESTTSPSFYSTTELDVDTVSLKVSTPNNTTITNTTPSTVSTCLCPCECATPMSRVNADKMLASMLEDLRIPKSKTSLSKRKLSSATDHRVLSKSIGLVGAFVMTIVFGIILIGDVKLFLHNARTALSHIRGHYGI